MRAIFEAAGSVNQSILFAACIIIAAFIPLFTLSGVEGHIFGPMAKTYAYALAGGLIATFTITPALSAVLLPEHVRETETWIMRWSHRLYAPVLRLAIANKVLVIGVAIGLFALAGVTVRLLGLEFLPKLEEGNLWIRATMPSTISLDAGNEYANKMRAMIRSFPEVSVVSQQGRPDDGTDAAGAFNAEFFAPLKPAREWRQGLDKDKLTAEILGRLQGSFPGVEFNFSQYLQDNVAEAVSGVKGENSIKLFGNDLRALTDTANKIKGVLATVQGITDLAVFTSLGQPTIQIDIDRARAARVGLTPGDINATVQAAIGGQAAGDVYEPGSDRHFPIVVRLAPPFRQNIEAINNLRIVAGAQRHCPNSSQPGCERQSGIRSVVHLPRGATALPADQVQRSRPRSRECDPGGAGKISSKCNCRPGSGSNGSANLAICRTPSRGFKWWSRSALGMIALLLWVNFGSVPDTLLAMSVIPMALLGGVFALSVTGSRSACRRPLDSSRCSEYR